MKGFVVKVWEVMSEIKFDHCLIHPKAICLVFSRMGFMKLTEIC
jgi:hypothetical protein